MAAEQGYTLSEQAVRKIVDDHRRLSHQVYRIEQRLPATNDPPDWGRELLWGKTTKRPGESYPEEGDTYSVLLASRSYDQTAVGSKAVTDADSSDGVYVTARTLTGCSLPEDTYVELERLWGKDGVQYWIRPPFATVRKVVLNDSLAIDGSAEARLYIDGADSGETITVHWNWIREGSTIDADTELLAIWFEDESKWCIIPPPVPGAAGEARPACVLPNGGGYNKDSTNRNLVKFGNASTANNRFCYLHWNNYWGDPTGVGLEFITTASRVQATTDPETTAVFRVTQAGLYRFVFSLDMLDTTTTAAPETFTLTTSNASAGTAHTHTVNVEAHHAWWTQAYLQLEWRNPGGGAWNTAPELWQIGYWPQRTQATQYVESLDYDIHSPLVLYDNCDTPNREYRFLVFGQGEKSSIGSPAVTKPTSFQYTITPGGVLLEVQRLSDYVSGTIVP